MDRTAICLATQTLPGATDVLGAHTKVDTALREIAHRARRLGYVKALAEGDIDLGEETLRGAWR